MIGSPHEEPCQIGKVRVVRSEGNDLDDDLEGIIQDEVKQETAPYEFPRRIEFVQVSVKTSNGKISRTEIRERET